MTYQIVVTTEDEATAKALYNTARAKAATQLFTAGNPAAPNLLTLAAAGGEFPAKAKCVHFVGFRGDEFWSAVKVWGQPDYIHLHLDERCRRELADEDVVVFARGSHLKAMPWNYDDSNERDDPAYWERIEENQRRYGGGV